MEQIKAQRRGQSIAMNAAERDAFLAEERTCRVATVGADGQPHVTPMWYVWSEEALWLYSLVRTQRWLNLQRDPRLTAMVDAGREYLELRGVEISGRVTFVGEQPRVGDACPELEQTERLYGQKYRAASGGRLEYDGRHAWLRVTPTKIVSWDSRKIRAARSQ